MSRASARVARRTSILTVAVALGWPAVGRAQTRIIGHVVDGADRAPVHAAVVVVTGTTIETRTLADGTFALGVPADARSLTIRGIGFLSRVIPLDVERSDYTIVLQHDVLRLEAQVATGLATTVGTASAATAVAVVPGEDVNRVPAPTLESALQGQVVGALVDPYDGGAPGGGYKVQIRGITSVNTSGAPLYVVDGIIINNETIDANLGVNRVSDLNPADVERVEVLEGASASAIYGAQGSAGVILITTKKGTAGRPQWHLSGTVGRFSDARTLDLRAFPTLASAQSWYVHDVAPDTGNTGAEDAYIKSLYAGPQDYQSQLFGNGQASYETDLSVSGTQGRTRYFASGLAKYDNGVMANTGYAKQTVRTNVTQEVVPALSVSANLAYMHDDTRRGISGAGSYASLSNAPYGVFSYTPQFLALDRQNADGSWPTNPFGPVNPFADAAEIQTPQTLSRFIGGGNLTWTPWKTEHQSLQVSALGGTDISSLHDLFLAPATLQEQQLTSTSLPGEAVRNNATMHYSNYALSLVHRITKLPAIDFTTSVGFERDHQDLTNPVIKDVNLLTGVNPPTTGSVQEDFYYSKSQTDQSWYGQEQLLTLGSRLTLTAGVTAERSTLDGAADKYYDYPRYAASYRIPQFVSFLDELKVRAAYGESGSLAAGKYTSLSPTIGGGLPGVNQNFSVSLAEPERERETELGFDATMLRSRAQLSATLYQKRITDALLFVDASASAGYSGVPVNGGAFTNHGVELSLTTTPIQSRGGFAWVSTATYYRNYSVLTALPAPSAIIGPSYGAAGAYLISGRSVSEFVSSAVGPDGLPLQVGDFEPSFVVTTSQALSWHQFRLYGLLEWDRGGTVQNATDFTFDLGQHLLADSAASAARVALSGSNRSPYLQPATFVKLRDLRLSYDLPARWVGHAGEAGFHISNARLSLEGRNLVAWYSKGYDGLDPEVGASGLTFVRGVELDPYPPARSYFLALDLMI